MQDDKFGVGACDGLFDGKENNNKWLAVGRHNEELMVKKQDETLAWVCVTKCSRGRSMAMLCLPWRDTLRSSL